MTAILGLMHVYISHTLYIDVTKYHKVLIMKNLYYSLIPAAIRISVPKSVSPGHKEVSGMSTMKGSLRRLRIRKAPTLGIVALYVLLGLLTLAVMAGLLATPHSTVFADSTVKGTSAWLQMECLTTRVVEGDDFELKVRRTYSSDGFRPTMRVYWHTTPMTAGESDYEHLDAVRQVSNGYETLMGEMDRTFHTKSDPYSEETEAFKVWFSSDADGDADGRCLIRIKDDDGVGIHSLEITSVPGELPSETDDGETLVGYTAGDVIEITALFTGPVTTVNPDTSRQADYAGLHIQVGENRRLAEVLRGNGTDTVVFGYTVQPEDADADGISVEGGGTNTGLYYNTDSQDVGIWPVDGDGECINRKFRGLSDDTEHVVVPLDVDDPEVIGSQPAPEPPVEGASSISVGLIDTRDGELTSEDEGRDWFSVDLTGDENYIIELKSKMEFTESDEGDHLLGGYFDYVENKLIDPSILEIVDEQGEQVLSEHDGGGFMGNFARAFFVPDEDGTYYIAVGNGSQDPGGTGFYTLSIRADDYPDDYGANPGTMLRPGESVTGVIDSDVSPDDPGLSEWDWATGDGVGVPTYGVESLDDRDVFALEISESGTYEISVSDGPTGVGIWGVLNSHSWVHSDYPRTVPAESVVCEFEPGTYYVEVGTPYLSVGNTGSYTVTLDEVADDVEDAAAA